jgi:hypothetical protein
MAVDEELESRLLLSTFIMITNSQIARDPLALLCIAYLERDLAIFIFSSTSLSHAPRMTYTPEFHSLVGLYQFIRTAYPFPKNLSREYYIQTSLCHWSLLDCVGRRPLHPLHPNRQEMHLVHSGPALLRRPSPGRYPPQCVHGISVAIPLTRSSVIQVSRSRVPYPFCER